jgi:hypothetical protein
LVRRTWAPRGLTPKLIGFGRHRDKVSTIAAIVVSPRGRRVRLDWHTDPEDYIDAAAVVAFLEKLLGQLHGRVIVVWDGGSNHKGPLMRELLSRSRRLHLERLPAYAPDLNPVEWIWSYLKYGLMANFVPRDVRHVDKVVQGHLPNLGRDPRLLRSLWTGSKLPLVNKHLAT